MAKFSSFWEKRKGRSNRVVFIYLFIKVIASALAARMPRKMWH
jgi:hypothetical protein